MTMFGANIEALANELLTTWGTPNVSPKQKTTEEQRVEACSLVHSTLGVEGRVGAPDGTRKNDKHLITRMDLHQIKQQVD
jgi:hypothetical protein